MTKALSFTLILVCLCIQANAQQKSTEKKIDSILSLMTLEEKVGQMTMYNGSWDLTGPPGTVGAEEKLEKIKKGMVGAMLNVNTAAETLEAQKTVMQNSRLKIPLIFGYDVIHGYKTIFPVPLGESASWDLNMMQKTAAVAAKEASASGLHWTFAPMVDVARDARWGRVMEGAGEDPFLHAQIAVARIKGFQGDDLSNTATIAACAKHFAGYGFAEAGRDYNTVNIGLHELHNIILPPFKAAVDAGAATFMNAFNEIDGVPSTASSYLQRAILKKKWGWDGVMVSDWGSIGELIAHGVASNKSEAAMLAANAGSDMDMESFAYENHLADLIRTGKVNEALIDDSVKRILRLKFKLGLFDDPYKYSDLQREQTNIYTVENRKLAREAAKKSIVLLKNDTSDLGRKLLPLQENTIAVIGDFADDKDTPLGNWRAQAVKNSAVSVLEGLQAQFPEVSEVSFANGPKLTIDYLEEGKGQFLWPLKFNQTDTTGLQKAVDLARKSNVVLMVLGEHAYQTGEGRSQTELKLPGLQQQLLKEVYAVNPNIVLILMNGRPLDLSWEEAHIPAILETWHLGSEAGNAIADVILGKYNPSGKLPVSFPRNVGQQPLFYNHKNTGRPYSPRHVTYSGYTDSKKTALFPFGFGLSYTTFEYSNLRLSDSIIPKGGRLIAAVEVTNTGDVAGEEVVQLYLRDLVGSITRPVKELKGFQKISLKPGETKSLSFEITPELLQFYTARNIWEVEPGSFVLWIGTDSVSGLSTTFEVTE